MRKHLIYFILFLCCEIPLSGFSQKSNNELLKELDVTIAQKDKYIEQKEQRIENLRQLLRLAKDSAQIYDFNGKLFDEFRYYNTDSAFAYNQIKKNIALKLNDYNMMCDSRLNAADVYSLVGMYTEALEYLSLVNRTGHIPDYLKPYYYHLNKNIYGLMADYAINNKDRAPYTKLREQYRDSLLSIKPLESIEYIILKSDELINHKHYNEAIKLLKDTEKKLDKSDHNMALIAFSLSQAYRGKNDIENTEHYLILSAISDLQSATKDYVSLSQLAILLYKKNDIDRAYKYLKCSMEDAKESNARLRTVELSEVFPIIDKAYTRKSEQKRIELLLLLTGISVLSLILLITIIFIYKQMKKLADARRKLGNANNELNNLNQALVSTNDELNTSNSKLQETNDSLRETSMIKEEYIGRYMDLCSTYIEKMESYRKSLYKLLVANNKEKLVDAVKSTTLIDNELKEFYHNFDISFLQMFPDFVEDFNALLNDGEKVIPKVKGELNTELRIYALIRLGISDSVKIAQFLRYSVTTIYNYRTRIRNKAVCDRDKFEDKVMQIGANMQS